MMGQPLKTTRPRLLIAALLVAGAGCSDSGSDRPEANQSGSTDTSTTTAAPSTHPTEPSAAVIEAYLGYWRVVNAYGSEVGPFDPADYKARFSPVSTGAQYESLFTTMQVDRAQGLAYRGGEQDQFRPRVVELQSDRAVVEDCADDTGGVFDTRNNTYTENTTPGQHSLLRAVLRFEDGAWKVSTQTGGNERCTP